MKIEAIEYERWIFANDFAEGESILMELQNYSLETSKNTGNTYPVARFFGVNGKYAGDFKASMWAKNMQECLKEWGEDSDKWLGKKVELYVLSNGDKKVLMMKPAPSEINKITEQDVKA